MAENNLEKAMNKLRQNVANTYSALYEMGADAPAEENSDNLAATARTVKAGGGTGGNAGIAMAAAAEPGQALLIEEVDELGTPTLFKAAAYQPRTHGAEIVEVLPEITVDIDPDMGMGLLPDLAVSANDECTIVYNGTEYVCSCVYIDEQQRGFGNLGAIDENFPLTSEPFLIIRTGLGEDENGDTLYGWIIVSLDGSATVTLSIFGEVIEKIAAKYIDNTAFIQYVDREIAMLRNNEIASIASDVIFNRFKDKDHIDLFSVIGSATIVDNEYTIEIKNTDVARDIDSKMHTNAMNGHPRLTVELVVSEELADGTFSANTKIRTPIQVIEHGDIIVAGIAMFPYVGDFDSMGFGVLKIFVNSVLGVVKISLRTYGNLST